MKEIEATENKEEQKRNVNFYIILKTNNINIFQQTEILKQIFIIYFRILKKSKIIALLPSVMKGFSRLILLILLN